MAKPNYAFEKRQKELAKKQKKQEKLQQRQGSATPDAGADAETAAGQEVSNPPHPSAD
jgi:hypothetical protein